MSKLVFSNIFRFLALIVLQILILNYVYLGGFAVPFIYLLAILMLPTRLEKIPLLLIAFASGMLIDIFCNVPGFHTFSCTMMGFARILFGNTILTHDDAEIDTPNIRSVPASAFMLYLLLMIFVYSFTFNLIEAFSFGNFWLTMLSVLLDTAITWVLLMLCQLFISPSKK